MNEVCSKILTETSDFKSSSICKHKVRNEVQEKRYEKKCDFFLCSIEKLFCIKKFGDRHTPHRKHIGNISHSI